MPGLTQEQVDRFEEQGYLVVEGLIDVVQYLDPLLDEYAARLDQLADEMYAAGKLSSTYADLPFGRRLTQIYAETGQVFAQYFDFSLPFNGVTRETPCHFGPAVFNMLTNSAVLDVVESLIGPEICSNPVQHVRLKPPEKYVPRNPTTGHVLLGATPWHQDAGVGARRRGRDQHADGLDSPGGRHRRERLSRGRSAQPPLRPASALRLAHAGHASTG